MTHFGVLLHRFRERSGFTQSELSGFSTISVRAIRNLELGQARNPRRDTVRLIADALRLSGEHRAALQLAAGHRADDAAFDNLPPLFSGASRPLRGREPELEQLLRLFRLEPQRLAGVTGLGGVGKTRLALAVAQALRTQDNMATLWWQLPGGAGPDSGDDRDLPPLTGMGNLLAARGGSTGDTVRLIGDRPVLLVLDGNDRDQVARSTLEELLDHCQNLQILVTSRTVGDQPLRGPQLSLRPLPVSAPAASDDPIAAPAAAVFLDRLAEVQESFRIDQGTASAVLELCDLLDGLPRALESAASWLTVSSLHELVELARTQPHVIAETIEGGEQEDRWVETTLTDAMSELSADKIDLLRRLAHWDDPWTVQDLVRRLGVDRVRAAAAVHAFLRCGLVRKVAEPNCIAFGVMHLMRTYLQNRVPDSQ